MTIKEQIRNGFNNLKKGEVQTFPAHVKSVDEQRQTCTVMAARDEMYIRVRLKSVIDGQPAGIYCIPAVASSVLISLIGNNKETAYVSRFSKVDKVIIINEAGLKVEMTDEKLYLENGESSVTISENEILLNDGSLKGLIKIEELKKELEKNSQLLQAIKDTFANWTPLPNDGGAALKTASAALTPLQVGKWDQIENEKIKHG